MNFADKQVEINNGEFIWEIPHIAKDGRVKDVDSGKCEFLTGVVMEIRKRCFYFSRLFIYPSG
jgi:hypothetical protein